MPNAKAEFLPEWIRSGPAVALLMLALMMQLCFTLLWKLNNWNNHIPAFLGSYLFAFLVYGIAAKLTLQGRFDRIPRASSLILFAAILFRFTVFWCLPSLSEDFYRYIWDGRVQVEGMSPYDYPPQAPELEGMRDQVYDKLKFRDIRTPYPATAQNLFHLLARISENIFVFKFGIVLFEILLLGIVRRLLQKEQRPPTLLLLYAWHPLPIIEFFGSAHLDIIGISLLMAAVLFLQDSRRMAGGFSLALAAFVKYLPVFAVPWLWKKGGWRFLMALAIVGAILFFQFYTPDLRMLAGLQFFYTKARFNDSLFAILYSSLGAEPARRLGALAVFLSVAISLWKRWPLYRSLLVIFGTAILFSPVVHPWYVCWLIPLFVFQPSLPWIFFTGWIAVSYIIRYLYPVGLWPRLAWLQLLVYGPFFILLLWSTIRPLATKLALSRKQQVRSDDFSRHAPAVPPSND